MSFNPSKPVIKMAAVMTWLVLPVLDWSQHWALSSTIGKVPQPSPPPSLSSGVASLTCPWWPPVGHWQPRRSSWPQPRPCLGSKKNLYILWQPFWITILREKTVICCNQLFGRKSLLVCGRNSRGSIFCIIRGRTSSLILCFFGFMDIGLH